MKKKILVIDDDPSFVEFVRIVLESHSYQVFDADNEEEGLKKLKQIEPDLIILDVMMETTAQGFWICEELKSKDPRSEYAKYSNIPILILTAIGKETGLRISLDKDRDYVPADDYAEKPIKPQELVARVEALLKEK